MRIASIGLGDIAEKAYLPIIATYPGIRPVLCTRNPETLTRIASQYRIAEAYTSIDELISSKPDAVMVHSSTESHYAIIKKLLTARIPVFVDKPLAYTITECDELIKLAQSAKTLLYVGFNRRFVPLIKTISKEQEPTQIIWTKNRANLPGDPRVFVFDDFIHVLDSLRFLSKGSIEDLQVRFISSNNLLENIQVLWCHNKTLIQGNMNRMSGYTQERIEYATNGNTWLITDFESGSHYHNERQEYLKQGSWDNTLHKKGFYNLIDDWLAALQETAFNTNRLEDIRETHQLCEEVVQRVLAGCDKS